MISHPLLWGQTYILNEDFVTASGITPPPGWLNVTVAGGETDLWHFDNPGSRTINYPITVPFAIFDADTLSDNGQAEKLALETPFFDASISNSILLEFDHTYLAANGSKAIIEAFDGNNWSEILRYAVSTTNPTSEIIDISDVVGNVASAKLRFLWEGNGRGFWAIDNVRIVAPLPYDGGLVKLDSPIPPINPGNLEIRVTLGNYGYQKLTSSTISWSVDGILQADYSWTGDIDFGEVEEDILLGTYSFTENPAELVIWQSFPNGIEDPNPFNDTLSRIIIPTLCGDYTVGGENPDFETITDAINSLKTAGVYCPVRFLIRPGEYALNESIPPVLGASEINTVTFTSENADSTSVIIKSSNDVYDYIIKLAGASHLRFENLGFEPDNLNYFLFTGIVDNIFIRNNYFNNTSPFGSLILFDNTVGKNVKINNNRFISAGNVVATDGSFYQVEINNNYFEGTDEGGRIAFNSKMTDVSIDSNYFERGHVNIASTFNSSGVKVRYNIIESSNQQVLNFYGAGISEVLANQLTAVENGTGIYLNNCIDVLVANNFVQTVGVNSSLGIYANFLSDASIVFNSLNIQSEGPSSHAIYIGESPNNLVIKNNIFSNPAGNIPVFILDNPTTVSWDFNDYYSSEFYIGFHNGVTYSDLGEWQAAINGEANAQNVNPYFSAPDNPAANHILLNDKGIAISGVLSDIDGTPRGDPPDIGAKEYNPCSPDAGVDRITAPQNPIIPGSQDVKVILQNQGTTPLTSVRIQWKINDELQTPFDWTGNLAVYQGGEVVVGTYSFLDEAYDIFSWTELPNGEPECNNYNDTSNSYLAPMLCGDYTIGGNNPDFSTIGEAIDVLNTSGVSCAVRFLIRPGEYALNKTIFPIAGSSVENTVTFTSETGDSSSVKIASANEEYNYTFKFDGTDYLRFKNLGFMAGNDNPIYVTGIVEDMNISNCLFGTDGNFSNTIRFQEVSATKLEMRNNVFPKGGRIFANGDYTNCRINSNYFFGTTEWGSIVFNSILNEVFIDSNYFNKGRISVYTTFAPESVYVRHNTILKGSGKFINLIGYGVKEAIGNRLTGVEGGVGLYLNNCDNVRIANNYIQTQGTSQSRGISLNFTKNATVAFNSMNVLNTEQTSHALFVGEVVSNLTVKNNIFCNPGGSIPVYIENSVPSLTMDYNDYFSPKDYVGYYNGLTYEDMSAWKQAISGEEHAQNIDPVFSAIDDPSVNHILLNNKGTSISWALVDIDGSPRGAVPDIGAKEYNPCAPDAGVDKITSPQNAPGTGNKEVKVLLQNQGTTSLSSVGVRWTVNGQLQTPYSWTGNLPVYGNQEITIGSFNFQEQSYDIKAWTENPNGQAECNLKNDTSDIFIASSLCGNYTIGGTNPDFATIADAIEILNESGVSCAVRFFIRPGDYSLNVIIPPIPGSSPSNSVTFMSENGDSTSVRIMPLASGASTVFKIDGAAHLRFKNLGFSSGGGNYFYISGIASDIIIANNYFDNDGFNPGSISFSNAVVEYVEITNNMFPNGGNIVGNGSFNNCTVSNNSFFGETEQAAISFQADLSNLVVDHNYLRAGRITAIGTSAGDGVFITYNNIEEGGALFAQGPGIAEVVGNRVTGVKNGTAITISSCQDIIVANNYAQTYGDVLSRGIFMEFVVNSLFVFNSMNVLNEDLASNAFRLEGISTGLTVKNNIFYCAGGNIPVFLESDPSTYDWDYNNYKSSLDYIGYYDGVAYTDLWEWGQVINGDANSKNVNPFFVGDTDPLPLQRDLNGGGIPIDGIILDIYGVLRNNQAPDIGAVEFMLDLGISRLISPSLNCSHTQPDSVTVLVKQYGDLPFADIRIAYTVNGGEVHQDTIPGTIDNDIVFTFADYVDITADGDYLFKIWLISTLDDNLNNDTLTVWRYSKPSPQVDFTFDNVCTGRTVRFEGTASVEAPYYIDAYEWLFGDGDTAYGQKVAHEFLVFGNYPVDLRAYSNAGCYNNITKTVPVDFEGVHFEPEVLEVFCPTDCNGAVNLVVVGGTEPIKVFFDGNEISDYFVTDLCAGDYPLKAVDSEGCEDTSTVTIGVEHPLDVLIVAEPTIGPAPLDVDLLAESEEGSTFEWYYRDTLFATGNPAGIVLTKPGGNIITVLADGGPPYYCSNTDTVLIWVDVDVEILLPNAFTPNGDGYNDTFGATTNGIEELKMEIFDRWGRLVFKIDSIDGRWDGTTMAGKEAPDGVYFYVLTATAYDYKSHVRQGNVNLYRDLVDLTPNPVRGTSVFDLKGRLSGSIRITVLNMAGLVVRSWETEGELIKIDASLLSPGAYILKATDGVRTITTKLIKR
ncbi:MAG: gliding motility-associated C-terminal domain-containing protein [Bacteroidales bacterium]|nr:gliding motility-associated C-terminal domain-containing protein [Bacteroidales bacterium]